MSSNDNPPNSNRLIAIIKLNKEKKQPSNTTATAATLQHAQYSKSTWAYLFDLWLPCMTCCCQSSIISFIQKRSSVCVGHAGIGFHDTHKKSIAVDSVASVAKYRSSDAVHQHSNAKSHSSHANGDGTQQTLSQVTEWRIESNCLSQFSHKLFIFRQPLCDCVESDFPIVNVTELGLDLCEFWYCARSDWRWFNESPLGMRWIEICQRSSGRLLGLGRQKRTLACCNSSRIASSARWISVEAPAASSTIPSHRRQLKQQQQKTRTESMRRSTGPRPNARIPLEKPLILIAMPLFIKSIDFTNFICTHFDVAKRRTQALWNCRTDRKIIVQLNRSRSTDRSIRFDSSQSTRSDRCFNAFSFIVLPRLKPAAHNIFN